MKRFKIFIAFFAFMLTLTTLATATFAYWDLLTKTQNETLQVGNGVELIVEAQAIAPAGKVLVPSGVVLKPNDVTEIVLTYNVRIDQEIVDDLTLSVTFSDVKIGGDSTNAGLVNISISQATSNLNNSDVLVTVTITLSEPADEAQYNAIKNQPITFTLTFTGA